MGYTFIIGNAVPEFDRECFPELIARWTVKYMTHPDAPVLPNDPITLNSNSRSPSYSVWADFCRSTGLYDMFYNSGGNLIAGHPGCMGITEDDADRVSEVLRLYQRRATLPPGFEKEWDYEGEPNYDYHLARLIWLEWWMQWAVHNCDIPAIANW